MAEFELRLKYTNAPMQAVVHALALLFPVWGVLIPITLVLFTVLLLRLPSNVPIAYALFLIAGMLFVTLCCTALSLIFDDTDICINKDGLRFPIKFLPSLRFVGHHSWQDLVNLKLNWKRQDKFSSDETMTFVFQDGGVARLKLQHLDRAALEQFFIAFEACAYKCERDAELPDFERSIQESKPGSLYSYTQLWEKSLANKFSGATFTPLEPDTRVQEGRFQILRQLAFGGFSAIYLARPETGGFVVLKESSFPQTDDVADKATELFRREATLLSKLDHPNIAKVQDYFIENGRHYLVVQHIEGIDLSRLVMQGGPQSPDLVRNWLWQLAGALAYLHEQSPPIVHRDITPDNLLLKPDGTLMLIDFGAAKEIVSNFTGTVIGKHGYMAPEQLKGKPSIRSDVYGLGATAYYLLTGRQPEPLTQSSPGQYLESLPVELGDLVTKCTNLDEGERLSCSEIRELLQPKQLVGVETA